MAPWPRTSRDCLDDHVAEDLGRFAQHGDAGGDLAQRLLRLGLARQRVTRAIELVDQAGGGDGDGRLVGDRDQEGRVGLAPEVGGIRVDGQGTERPRLPDERRRHDRVDAGALDVGVGAGPVREAIVVEVVAGPLGTAAHDGLAGDALVEGLVRIVGPGVGIGTQRARGIRPAQQPGRRDRRGRCGRRRPA